MNLNKAVILAGGSATRLNPLSIFINKHLLPIHNKPMIYYSLEFLIKIKIKNILIICNRQDLYIFKKLVKEFPNLKLSFKVQVRPKGIADGLNLCKKFVGPNKFIFLLGDNLLDFRKKNINFFIKMVNRPNINCTLFTSKVLKPNQFGIISQKNDKKKVIEKPRNPQNNKAVIGLYVYDFNCFKYLKKIKSSKRGELEITDINNHYLYNQKVSIVDLDKLSVKWFDIGTFENFSNANIYMKKLCD